MNRFLIFALVLIIASTTAACNPFKEKEDNADLEAAELYARAKRQLDKKNYTKAIELYQEIQGSYPFGSYAQQAQLEIGYAYFKDEQLEAAIAAADRFIRLHPTHPSVDYAYYLKGLVNHTRESSFLDIINVGIDAPDRDPRSMTAAYQAFDELVTKFPESVYVADAKRRMASLFNNLAMHEIYVADYYMRREAYVAVVNRCKLVLERYPRTAATEHALGLMTVAYDRMDMKDLSEDTRRVLELNYPESGYLNGRTQAVKR